MSGSILQGVKLGTGSLTGRLSRRVRELLMPWNADLNGVVTYSFVEPVTARQAFDDRRSDLRRRTRLRSGKVVDRDNGFIVECLVHERSTYGARLQLARMVEVPDRIGFFDDAEQSIRAAEIVWRRGHQLGIRFTPELDPEEIKESDLASLSGKFYAVDS
jgi:hypothetical protein